MYNKPRGEGHNIKISYAFNLKSIEILSKSHKNPKSRTLILEVIYPSQKNRLTLFVLSCQVVCLCFCVWNYCFITLTICTWNLSYLILAILCTKKYWSENVYHSSTSVLKLEALRLLSPFLSGLPNLKYLNLADCSRLTGTVIEYVAGKFRGGQMCGKVIL